MAAMLARKGKKIALIGYGAISKMVIADLVQDAAQSRITVDSVLVRENRVADVTAALPPSIRVVTSIDELISGTPDCVVECAGQSAVRDLGELVLSRGYDLMVISTGAFADNVLFESLRSSAHSSGARILLPSGAIAGLDGLTALRVGGLDSVRYTSTKPPSAWRGTPAERSFDLNALTEATVIFSGSPSDAAAQFPKNANLAMTVALAGAGVEKTEIQLVADPTATNNKGRIQAEGRYGRLDVEMEGKPAPGNPKTSASTALSIIHAIRLMTSVVVMG